MCLILGFSIHIDALHVHLKPNLFVFDSVFKYVSFCVFTGSPWR